jgi:hypothetical protein
MHDTLNKDVTGFIDYFRRKDDITQLKGWCFHKLHNNCKIRLKYHDGKDGDAEEKIIDNDITDVINSREDVLKFYKFHDVLNSGVE